MKIQLKRSNVLDAGIAKPPSQAQMDYGEIAVNYNNSDPVLFIKDSGNNIIRLAGADSAGVNDGDININAGTGLTATGPNASANQAVDTTRVLSVDTTWLDDRITSVSPAPGDGQIRVNGGTGIKATGTNGKANQAANTTRTLSIDETWIDDRISNVSPAAGDGIIAFNAGPGLIESGDNATANQSTNTVKTFGVDYVDLNTKYLSTAADAGNQTVASTGNTTFVGKIVGQGDVFTTTVRANYYSFETLAPLP